MRFLHFITLTALLLAAPAARAEPGADLFLNNLVGCWRLNGQMGETPLHQDVEARWSLGGQFVEMRFRQTDGLRAGGGAYEAIYLIGRDNTAGRYVLNLFDSFGVTSAPIPGLGVAHGNSVQFFFPYADGDFFNTFVWRPDRQAWTMVLERRDAHGDLEQFATKTLTRC